MKNRNFNIFLVLLIVLLILLADNFGDDPKVSEGQKDKVNTGTVSNSLTE